MPKKRLLPTLREVILQIKDQDLKNEQNLAFEFKKIKKFIDEHYKRPAHVYSVVNKLILRNFGNEHIAFSVAKKIIRETRDEQLEAKKVARKSLEFRNDHVTCFERSYVARVFQILNSSVDPVDKAVLLQLCCGVRIRDIFDDRKCNFELSKSHHIGYLTQLGSSKKRRPFTIEKKILGLNPQQFLDELSSFREEFGGGKAVVNAWNARLCARSTFYFPIPLRSGTHINRAIYAALLRDLNEGKSSNPRITQNALGHDSMSTSLHYLYVEIRSYGFAGNFLHLTTTEGANISIITVPPRTDPDQADIDVQRFQFFCFSNKYTPNVIDLENYGLTQRAIRRAGFL